jgi:hypothetical protein
MPNPPGSISGLSSLHPFFGAMMLEFRGALNLISYRISYRELDTHPETFSLAKQTSFSGSCSGASLLLLSYFQVILNGSPALASLQMMPWTLTMLDRFSLLDFCRVVVVWLGGTREVDS